MTQGIQRPWSSPDNYEQAVADAGVTELPDPPRPSGRALPAELVCGRCEGSETSMMSRYGPRSAARLDALCRTPPLPPNPSPAEVAEANARFVARIVSWHRIETDPDGELSPSCTCGVWAVTCAYVRLRHEILGHPVPWDTENPPPAPFREA